MSSQNPTPVTSTLPVNSVKWEDEMPPQFESIALRAAAMAGRLNAEATQVGAGNSTIIFRDVAFRWEITRWMSESSSTLAEITRAFTVEAFFGTGTLRGSG